MLCKNARLNGPHKLAELLVELATLDWDIILFSETRAESKTVEIEGGHCLYLHRGEYVASGVGVLIHARLVDSIRSTHFVSDRVLRVDLELAQRKISTEDIMLCCLFTSFGISRNSSGTSLRASSPELDTCS